MLKAGFIGAGGRAQSAHYDLARIDVRFFAALCQRGEGHA